MSGGYFGTNGKNGDSFQFYPYPGGFFPEYGDRCEKSDGTGGKRRDRAASAACGKAGAAPAAPVQVVGSGEGVRATAGNDEGEVSGGKDKDACSARALCRAD